MADDDLETPLQTPPIVEVAAKIIIHPVISGFPAIRRVLAANTTPRPGERGKTLFADRFPALGAPSISVVFDALHCFRDQECHLAIPGQRCESQKTVGALPDVIRRLRVLSNREILGRIHWSLFLTHAPYQPRNAGAEGFRFKPGGIQLTT